MKPKIGISACLLGEKVRYDGDDRRDAYIVDELGKRFDWVPLCPEVEAGLGVPRETIRLEREAAFAPAAPGAPAVLGAPASPGAVTAPVISSRVVTTETGVELTGLMRAHAAARAPALIASPVCGFILKKNSPSCGLSGVKLYSVSRGSPGDRVSVFSGFLPIGIGVFAGALAHFAPALPRIDEEGLRDPARAAEFCARVMAVHAANEEKT
jgi:uncharacterized protein YbbK (DUF523 family)